MRGLVRRKRFGISLGSQILRLGGSDPSPPGWGGARRAQRPAQGSTLADQSALSTNFLNYPHQLSATPLPATPAWPGAGSQGEARAGSRAVSCGSRVEPSGAGCRGCVHRARGVAAPRSHPGRPPPACGPRPDGEPLGPRPAGGRPLPAPGLAAASVQDTGR